MKYMHITDNKLNLFMQIVMLCMCNSQGMLFDKLARKDRVLTKSPNFLTSELIDANVKFEVRSPVMLHVYF